MSNNMLKVAAIQTKVSNDLEKNLKKTAHMIEKAAKKGAKIICLQELYRTPYFPQYKNAQKDMYAESIPGVSTDLFREIAKKYEVVIVVPVFEKDTNGQFHNSAVVINDEGKLLDVYHKIHIPQDPLFYEKDYFKKGDTGYHIYKTKYGNFAVLICYDQWFPEAARTVKLHGADLVFYPTAIGTIKGEKQKEGDWHEAWEIIMRSHAIANSLHVVAVNRVGTEDKLTFWGQSFVASPFGEVIKRASKRREQIIYAEIDLSKNKIVEEEWGFMRNRRTDTYNTLIQKNDGK